MYAFHFELISRGRERSRMQLESHFFGNLVLRSGCLRVCCNPALSDLEVDLNSDSVAAVAAERRLSSPQCRSAPRTHERNRLYHQLEQHSDNCQRGVYVSSTFRYFSIFARTLSRLSIEIFDHLYIILLALWKLANRLEIMLDIFGT